MQLGGLAYRNFYMQAIAEYLLYILFQEQVLISVVDNSDELKHKLEPIFVMNKKAISRNRRSI